VRLFSRRPRAADQTIRSPAPESAAGFEIASRTHAGTVRTLNEDRLLAIPELGLLAVADGMGGHDCGDIAAQTVIGAISAARPASRAALGEAIEQAHRSLTERAYASAAISGSTVVALLLRDGGYECLWAGDSELWLVRDGEARKLTHDHSLVEELIRSGSLAESERRRHPYSHVITRAVGVAETILLDEVSGAALAGDIFLLCSDGLTGAVDPARFAAIGEDQTLEAAAESLLRDALGAGASDNVSFILVRAATA
jgi:serine/threonine-protein phosphatase Stp1